MALVSGVGLASGVSKHPEYSAAYEQGQGALIVEGFSPLHGFGKFCSVICALGLIANTVAPTYSAGIDFQILGRYAEAVNVGDLCAYFALSESSYLSTYSHPHYPFFSQLTLILPHYHSIKSTTFHQYHMELLFKAIPSNLFLVLFFPHISS